MITASRGKTDYNLHRHKFADLGAVWKYVAIADRGLRYQAEVEKFKGAPRWAAALKLKSPVRSQRIGQISLYENPFK